MINELINVYNKKYLGKSNLELFFTNKGVTHTFHRGLWISCYKFVDSNVNNY